MDNTLISTNFKVPKLKIKKFLEPITLESNQFTTEIYPKIVQSFIKPKQSENCFRLINGWFIHNTQAENLYIKRRHLMRKENSNVIESIGFVFIKSKDHLVDLARNGLFRIGNISESFLSTASLGVSVCQHADVYHPGGTEYSVPKFGFLAICKYLKGRINFVQFDRSPMEPQPQFDCHMLKNNTIADKHTNIFNAFHKTQVFIYEYNEDGEIIKYPSQILPFAAVEFNWYGDYVYRISGNLFSKDKSSKIKKNNRNANADNTDSSDSNNIQRIGKHVQFVEPKRLSRFLSIDNSIHRLNSTFNLPCQILFKNDQINNLVEVKITCIVYMYMTNPVVFPQLYSSRWNVSDIVEISEFEKELKLFQFHLQDKISKSSTDLLDPLSHDIIISKTSPTLLTISENQINESFLYSNDTTIPKYTTYMRLVPDSCKQSRYNTLKLIDHFRNTKTIGRISFGGYDKISYKNIMFFFPDGKFSQKLGIPTVKEDDCYFHGLILHFQHPEFTICNLGKDSLIEKSLYFAGLSSYKKQSVIAKFNEEKSIIDVKVLKETCEEQAAVQKTFFSHLLKPINNDQCVLKYSNLAPWDSLADVPSEKSMTSAVIPPVNILPCKISITETINKYAEKIISTAKKKISEAKYLKQNSIQIKKLKKKNVKKRKISDNETKDLKTKLYNILKNPLENPDIIEEESHSEKNESDSQSISALSKINNEPFDFDQEDLVPLPNKISFDISNKGRFNELIFLNENCAKIDNSKALWYVQRYPIKPLKQPNKFEKMWAFNRTIFRKVKHIAGLSFYDG